MQIRVVKRRYFVNKHVEMVQIALLAMQRHSWEQGVAMQAFYELGKMDIVVAMAKEAVYRSLPDGRVATIGVTDAITDSCSVGEALIAAAQETKDKDLLEGAEKLLNWALYQAPKNQEGVLYHLLDRSEFWVDSMYMLPPYLAAAGYYEEALINIKGYFNALYDEKTHTMHHMWDDHKKEYVREAHWGVGNGWALAGLARVIDLLPETYEQDKKDLIAKAKELLDGVLSYKRKDGLFHDIIDDESTFVETNLSQMVAYTIYRGVYSNWLSKEYVTQAENLRTAVLDKVDKFGLVQGVCGAPTFDKAGVAPEGQAFFLLMEAAAARYK